MVANWLFKPVGPPEHRFGHAERLEDPFANELVERPAREYLDQPRLDVVRDRVDPPRAGLIAERQLAELPRELREIGAEEIRLAIGAVEVRVALGAVEIACGVAEHVLDRGLAHCVHDAAGVAVEHAGVRQLRQIARDRLVELELAFLVEDQQRHARHWLGHRVDVEVSVAGHRAACIDVSEAVGVLVDDLAVSGDVSDDARNLARVDICVEVVVEPLEPLARHAGYGVFARSCGAESESCDGERGGARFHTSHGISPR